MNFTTRCLVGHFLLTHLLLDLIKRSTPARIVNLSSMAHSWGVINLDDINSEKSYSDVKAYSQSKLANVLFTRSLAKRLEGTTLGENSGFHSFCQYFIDIWFGSFCSGTGVTVYAVHPGVVQTDLWRHLSSPRQLAMKLVSPFTKDSVQGAQTSIYCAVEPTLENESGGYYRYWSICETTYCRCSVQTLVRGPQCGP